jgi:hypothetical protein
MAGKGRDTKARMQEAAIRLFAERGVEGTSVRDIAAAVGVTEAALYPRLATAIAFGCVLQPAVFLLYGRLEGGLADRAPEIAGAILRALGGPAA